MSTSAGSAYVDLEPRIGSGFTSAVVSEAEKAGQAGGQVLGGLLSKAGGLLGGLDTQLSGFGGPLTGQLATIGSHLDGVKVAEAGAADGASHLKEIGTAAYLGLGAAAAGFAVISAKAFLGGQQASATYDQALKNVGQSQDEYSGQLDKTEKKLATYGDTADEVELSAAQLTRATKDGGKALDDESLAADIAAGRRIDLASATSILVKVETGHVALLGRLGIATKDANGQTISSAEAVQRLTELYGGSAAAQAKTYGGELAALGAEAHNFEEEIGGKVVPVVVDFGKVLLDGVGALQTINSVSGGWLGTLAAGAFVVGGVLVGVTALSAGVQKLGGFLTTATGLSKAHAAAETEEAAATTSAVEAHVAVTEAATEEAAADEELAASQLQLFTATEEVVAAEGQLAFLLPEMATEATAASTAVDALAGSEEVAATSAGLLAGGLSLIAPAIAAVAAGFIIGDKAGNAINSVLGGMKPNVDQLSDSFGDLAKSHVIDGAAASDYGDHLQKLAGDLNTIKGNVFEKAFGFAPSAHQAVKDIDAANQGLEELLQKQGITAASEAFGDISRTLIGAGQSATTVDSEFGPFLTTLSNAQQHAKDTTGAVSGLAASLDSLAKNQLSKQSAQLSIADSFDQLTQAEQNLKTIQEDAAGTGPDVIAAAQQETSARQSLTSAIDSQNQAVVSLQDAQEKLAQFNGPTDSTIRSLEKQQIQDRVVTTPEEARQKDIDLLTFDENTANTRESLQKQVESAEHGVATATNSVATAQAGVATAAQNRQKVQTDAAAQEAGAERKVQEAAIATALELQKAADAGTINNDQLGAYLTLLQGITKIVDPTGALSKGLTGIVKQMQLGAFYDDILLNNALTQGPVGPQAPKGPAGATYTPGGDVGSAVGPLGPAGPLGTPNGQAPTDTPAPSVHIDARQTNHFHGSDVPSTKELDTLNRKNAIKLSAFGGKAT